MQNNKQNKNKYAARLPGRTNRKYMAHNAARFCHHDLINIREEGRQTECHSLPHIRREEKEPPDSCGFANEILQNLDDRRESFFVCTILGI